MICGLVPSTLHHIIIIFNPHVLTLWTELQEQVLLSDHNGSGDAGTFKHLPKVRVQDLGFIMIAVL